MVKKLKKEIDNKDFRVTIFGSARVKRGSMLYRQAQELGEYLGKKEIDVVTGGGPGLMEAANRGHKKTSNGRAHSIGLNIYLKSEQHLNKYLDVSKEFKNFSKRLDNFMLFSNVIVIMPGGIGTILEAFYSWQLIQTNKICNIPIIFIGDMWPKLIKWMEKFPLKNKFIGDKDLKLVFLAKNCRDAMKMIDSAYLEYKKGTKNYCLNYKKYKLY